MNIKGLIWSGLCIQCALLVFWLFRSPEVSGQLRVARDELQKGNANLPALVVRSGNSTVTTVIYDPAKSPSENLLARAKGRLSIATSAYESVVGIPVLAATLTAVLLIALLWSLRTKKPATRP